METSSSKIYIVGAGISGLIAAKTLEANGHAPVLLEATDSVGGRVKTDTVNGACYDHGFQVLLTAYPLVKEHLDFVDLKLHRFKPGALIFKNGKAQRIGDPLRDISALFPTVFATVGSLLDKIKIFTLTLKLKKKSIDEIFADKEKSTLDYLREYGFSNRMIENFFRPFFTGIFLEEDLRTPSRMFEFVFKMFGEGYAAVPQNGIGAISEQLAKQLKHSEIKFGCKVVKVASEGIHLENGEVIKSDATLVTTPLNVVNPGIDSTSVHWKSCDNLYFTVEKRTFEEGIIGLVANKAALTNNLYYPFGQTISGNPVLSVTVVKPHDLDEKGLVEVVCTELLEHCGITIKSYLKTYAIKQALPDIRNLKMKLPPNTDQKSERIFLAGDYLLNGSLNAAMASGESAAERLIETI